MKYCTVDDEYGSKPYLIGLDEVGRGCLAGPVVIAGVCWQPDRVRRDAVFEQLEDSKILDHKRRERLARWIVANATDVRVAVVNHIVIDTLNILKATLHGFELACPATDPNIPILIDGNQKPHTLRRARCVVGGDRRSRIIAAASIVAKTFRDTLMTQICPQFPHFGFDTNMGYGTRKHLAVLAEQGPTRLHRKSFGPVRRLCPQPHPGEEAFLEDLQQQDGKAVLASWTHFTAHYVDFSLQAVRRAVVVFQRAGLNLLPTPATLHVAFPERLTEHQKN